MRYQMAKSLVLFRWKIDFHVRRVLPEVIKDFFGRSSQNFMDLVYLIEFVVSREQRA